MLQLVPLPPAIWRAIPAQAAMLPTLTLVGAADAWRPMSLFPAATLSASLALLPGLAMAVLGARLPLRDRWTVFATLAVLATLSAVVGLMQFAGAAVLRFYALTNDGFATGFFANRNGAVDFFAIGLIAIATLFQLRRDLFERAAGRIVAIAAVGLLSFAVLATGSRTGIALVIVPVISGVQALISRPVDGVQPNRGASRRRTLSAVAIVLLAAGAAGAGAVEFTALRSVGARFALGNSERSAIWNDTRVAIADSMPLGTGFGTFIPVYAAIEQLDNVSSHYANRAHNDYLEVAVEGGVPGLALVFGFLVFVAVRCRSAWRSRDIVRRASAAFVVYTTVVIALHSLVDYPLRTLTIMTIAGWGLGVLLRGREDTSASASGGIA